jgi:hypothetical protein
MSESFVYLLRHAYDSEKIRVFASYDAAVLALREELDTDGFLMNYDLAQFSLDPEKAEYVLVQEYDLHEIISDHEDESDDLSTIDSDDEEDI